MKAPLSIALAQCDAILGDVDRNLAAHLHLIAEARAAGAGLVVFPELSLTGYQLRDLTSDVAMRRDDPRLAALREASGEIDVVAGFIESGDDHRLYNAAAYFSGGQVLHVHHKVYLPNYLMFEESRYWAAGDTVSAFDTAFGRVGLLTCEDMWHPSTSYLLFADRADIVLTPSASPARGVTTPDADDELIPGSTHAWSRLLAQQSTAFNMYSVYVNRVGVEDGTTYSGHSAVVDPFGNKLVALGLEPELATVTLDPAPLARRRRDVPMLRDERLDLTLGNLERIHRDRFGL